MQSAQTVNLTIELEYGLKLMPYKGYLNEACRVARAKLHGQFETHYKKSPPFSRLDTTTQQAIHSIADLIMLNRFDENDLPFNDNWQPKDIADYLKKNPTLKIWLFDKNKIAQLEANLKKANRWKTMLSDPAGSAFDFLDAITLQYPVPPVNWVLTSLSGTAYLLARLGEYQGQRYDPRVPNSDIKTSRIMVVSGVLAVTGTVLTLLTVPFVGPFLLAAGALTFSIGHLYSLGTSLKNLVKEIQTKEPKETYGLRIVSQVNNCLKSAMNAAFYLCVSILAVAAVVALFSNPVGLGVLAGAMFAIAISAAAVSLGSMITDKVVNWRIKKLEENAAKKQIEIENKAGISPELSSGLDKVKKEQDLRSQATLPLSSTAENHDLPLYGKARSTSDKTDKTPTPQSSSTPTPKKTTTRPD